MTGDPAIPPPTMLAAFDLRCRQTPDLTFVEHSDGTGLTYAELDRRASDLAERLHRQIGVSGDEPIGVYGGNEMASIIALIAGWRLGRPVAMCGRQLPVAMAAELLEGCGAVLILSTDSALISPRGLPVVTVTDRDEPAVTTSHPRAARVGLTRDALACICFSSGTTGKPKPIRLNHDQLMTQVQRISGHAPFAPALPTARPLISFAPFGHSAFLSRLALALWIGRGSVLVPKFTVRDAAQVIRRLRPRSLALTPTMIFMLAETDEDVDLSSLKWITSGSASLREETRRKFIDRFGVAVLQSYGMTEVGNIALERIEDAQSPNRPAGSVGRVSKGRAVRIVDHANAVLPPGEDGEIVVRDLTRPEGFTHLPIDADGYFHTGDRGNLTEDGLLVLTGRIGDQIIVGGFNVSPIEVENAMLVTGLLRDAVVVGVSDDRLGDVPVAAVVWNGRPDEEALRAALATKLAKYKFPRAFVSLPEVPLTNGGKVDRRAVREEVLSVMGVPSQPAMPSTVGRGDK